MSDDTLRSLLHDGFVTFGQQLVPPAAIDAGPRAVATYRPLVTELTELIGDTPALVSCSPVTEEVVPAEAGPSLTVWVDSGGGAIVTRPPYTFTPVTDGWYRYVFAGISSRPDLGRPEFVSDGPLHAGWVWGSVDSAV